MEVEVQEGEDAVAVLAAVKPYFDGIYWKIVASDLAEHLVRLREGTGPFVARKVGA